MIVITVLVLYLGYVNTQLFEGDKCTVPETNQNGQCINIHQCEYARKLLEQQKRPIICGFAKKVPLVCCPAPQKLEVLKSGAVSRETCTKYFGKLPGFVGIELGEKALPKEFPHMAAVGYGNRSISWLCGGSLISHFFVLTAAHCADSLDFGAAKWIRLGDLDLKNTTEDAKPIDMKIAQIYIHPQYKPASHYHDIALFRLENWVSFGTYISAACLHPEKNLPVKVLQATGWGQQGLFGDASNHLLKVDLNIVDHGACAKKYSDVSVRKLANGILDEYQMCAGDEEGKDTCPGDSGGPLHYLINATDKVLQHFYVAGITSFGKGCGGENSIAVYTRVSSYLDWIESIVWQGSYD